MGDHLLPITMRIMATAYSAAAPAQRPPSDLFGSAGRQRAA